MALVKLAAGIISIRGRFGGVYFKRAKFSQHIQAMPRHVNYNFSGGQASNRDSFSGGAGLWMLALLAFFAAAWATYAMINLFRTKDGEEKRITGYNWYMYYAMEFPEEDRPPFWQPPHSPGELPDFIVTWKGKWTYEHAPPDWPEGCPAGYFWPTGFYNDTPFYSTDEKNYYLWWSGETWVMSKILGATEEWYTFYSEGSDVLGYYYNPFDKTSAKLYPGKKDLALP